MVEIFRKAEESISKLLLVVCVFLVVVASLGRWFGYPIIWSVDMAQLLFIWICFLGANQALRRGQHIGVDILFRYLSAPVQRALEIVHLCLIAAFLSAIVYYGIELTRLNVERQFSDTPISYAFVTAAVPVGSALLLATVIGQLVGLFRKFGRA